VAEANFPKAGAEVGEEATGDGRFAATARAGDQADVSGTFLGGKFDVPSESREPADFEVEQARGVCSMRDLMVMRMVRTPVDERADELKEGCAKWSIRDCENEINAKNQRIVTLTSDCAGSSLKKLPL